MRLVITKRGQKRIASSREYLEDNFYPEYAAPESSSATAISRATPPTALRNAARRGVR